MSDSESLYPRHAESPSKCAECGVELHPGTAKCFTVCDAFWDKAIELRRAAREAAHVEVLRKAVEKSKP
jgi:hypothetical protein